MTDKISSEDFIKAFGGGVKHNLKRPQVDLISREALKEKLKERYYNDGLNIVTAIELIDNAPTMPLPNEQIAWEQGFEAGLAQGKHSRPQGEWIKTPDLFRDRICPHCKQQIPYSKLGKFCVECGADMRGGATNEKA